RRARTRGSDCRPDSSSPARGLARPRPSWRAKPLPPPADPTPGDPRPRRARHPETAPAPTPGDPRPRRARHPETAPGPAGHGPPRRSQPCSASTASDRRGMTARWAPQKAWDVPTTRAESTTRDNQKRSPRMQMCPDGAGHDLAVGVVEVVGRADHEGEIGDGVHPEGGAAHADVPERGGAVVRAGPVRRLRPAHLDPEAEGVGALLAEAGHDAHQLRELD